MATPLCDPEVRAFVRQTLDFYPEDAITVTIAQQREYYDRLCTAFATPRPLDLMVEETRLAGRPARRYLPKEPATRSRLLYLHGGGFLLGGLDSHDGVCADLAAGAVMEVFSLDYRLAPEHLHPAAYEDALAAFLALRKDGPVILAGDSAGGTLAAAVAATARKGAFPAAGQLLIYPSLGGIDSVASHESESDAPLLTTTDMRFYQELRTGGRLPAKDPTFSPLTEDDLSGLPKTAIFAAEIDPLRDEAVVYRDRLQARGVAVRFHLEKQLVHGYLRARGMSRRAAASFAHMLEDLRWLAR